ncbi:3-phosphoshikimate 1-carboxyvinyltransferase [Armatimonas rosea]|uniref:3-phosphoshikimate 1-carboxyvinyltransferase n=2 Tax=Armatimonas rosea TaxID=685828 RepID=A0A7W9SV70_ARMRO|nr:3-phosphoshikimate 1-carboxyvinyltransferase [Armatimonas rosea]
MEDCLTALGFQLEIDAARETIEVLGQGGEVPSKSAELFVGNSGTTARFISPLAALGQGEYHLDGVARMRERPIQDLVQALTMLGVEVVCPTGCPPLTIHARGLHGGCTTIRADASSQFLSGLLLAAPCASGETIVHLEGPILSAPYIEMTVAMVRQFGGEIEVDETGRTYRIPGGQTLQSPGQYSIEPDASAASYFFAAAAVTGGCVRVPHLSLAALQGDVAFVKVLEQMGCDVLEGDGFLELRGPQQLRGVVVDMNAISDTVMTLAAIAPFADSPTVIENVAHIRHKETDRLAAVTTELQRLGVRVEERPDGLTVYPATDLLPATIQTYDDHRMAMAFAITGLRSPGVVIENPGCVAKTFPAFFTRLEELCAAG